MATSIDQLYQETFGRAPDAEGLAFWTQALNNGTSLDHIAQEFKASPEYAATHAAQAPAPAIPTAGTMRWDDIVSAASGNQVNNYSANGNLNVGGGQYAGTYGYTPTSAVTGQMRDAQGNWIADNPNNVTLTGFTMDDPNNKNYQYTYTPDGSGGVKQTYREKEGDMAFLKDMAMMAAAAGGMYYGLTGLEGLTGGSGAAGAGGWVSGYDLPMGADLTGMTGVGAAAGAAGAAGAAAGGGVGTAGAAGAVGAAGAGAATGGLGSLLNPGTLIPAIGALGGVAAANQASKAQQAASDAATAEARRQYDLTRADQLALLAQTRADQAPWLQAGKNALGQLVTGTAAGGEFMKPIAVGDVTSEPGYQFGIQQGEQGINRAAAAKGGLYSGATLKALSRFNTDYGATKYNDAWNRVNSETTNRFNRLASLAGVGQTAAQSTASAGQSAYGTIANMGANTSNNIQNNMTGAGNARASGYMGAANAISNGIGQWYNNQQQQNLLSMLAAR